MNVLLRDWVLSLTGAALLGAFALALTPAGKVRRVTQLLCGVVMAIALISPLREFDFETYSMGMASYRDTAATAAARLDETNDRLSRTIIESECAAYILDKARARGLTPEEVTVTVKWGEALCWYPYEATLRTEADERVRRELSSIIEAELGIPAERLHWEDPAHAGEAGT